MMKKYSQHIKICGESKTATPKLIEMPHLCERKKTIWEMTNCCPATMCSLRYAMNISLPMICVDYFVLCSTNSRIGVFKSHSFNLQKSLIKSTYTTLS